MIAVERTRASVEEIQESVRHLSDEDRVEFWSWYWEMDEARWDKEFEEDVKAGRLDWLAEATAPSHSQRLRLSLDMDWTA